MSKHNMSDHQTHTIHIFKKEVFTLFNYTYGIRIFKGHHKLQ